MHTRSRVRIQVGDIGKWTPAPPKMVYALLRTSLLQLAHVDPLDPQMRQITMRIRRLSHYLVWLPSNGTNKDAASGEADEVGNADEIIEVDEVDMVHRLQQHQQCRRSRRCR